MYTFKKFERTQEFSDIVQAGSTEVTTGIWSGDVGSLPTGGVFLAEDQILAKTRDYYIDVYDRQPGTATDPEGLAEVQFAITYGHIDGGGSPSLQDNEQSTLPTKAIYSQYKNLLLDPSDLKFTFEGKESDHIYVINFQRNRVRGQLDPGNWQLPLSGANGFQCFIDDSGQRLGPTTTSGRSRVYRVVSGTLSGPNGIATASANYYTKYGAEGPGYGLVYPDLGIIVLNPNAIGPAVGFWTSTAKSSTGAAALSSVTSPIYDTTNLKTIKETYAPVTHSLAGYASTVTSAYNQVALFHSINNAISGSAGNTFREFRARSAEMISSTHYFVRLRNSEFNYSNNPTFYDENASSFTISSFKDNPQVYITTIGLYNDRNELLAVAKLSKPVRKSFDEEILLRVRLDF